MKSYSITFKIANNQSFCRLFEKHLNVKLPSYSLQITERLNCDSIKKYIKTQKIKNTRSRYDTVLFIILEFTDLYFILIL